MPTPAVNGSTCKMIPAIFRVGAAASVEQGRRDPVAAQRRARRMAGALIGIAGASADCEELWQIGIDVVASERGAGVGRALVSRLTAAVLEHDRVPFYATSIGHLRSRMVAHTLGFWPAWTEMAAVDPEP